MSRKKSSPDSPRERDGFSCIQPDLRWRRSSARVTQTGHSQSTVSLDVFMDATSLDAFGSGSFASKTVLALVSQPWSYLRLKAYSFIGLCEGAYGDFGGSALDDSTQDLTH